jgi:hypothetical protein
VKSKETLVATFAYVDEFMGCLRVLREKDCHIRSVFSPVHLPELEEILDMKRSLTRVFTLLGGITGGLGLPALAVWAHLSFKLIVYGKPVLGWIPWIIVAFEGMVLIASLSAFVSWVFKAGLPRPMLDPGYDSSFSGESFGVAVSVPEARRGEIEGILKDHGARETRYATI